MGIGSSRENCESSGVRVPVRLIACSRPIAYPMRAKATTHVLLGCKHLSCTVGKLRRLHPSRTCDRSEEHTSELQSHVKLVCRLLYEKKTPQGHLWIGVRVHCSPRLW